MNLPPLPLSLPKSQADWQLVLNAFQAWMQVLTGNAQTGTQAMAGTTQAVSFAFPMPTNTYRVALTANATGGPFWVTGKTITGFTINAPSSFTGNVDWMVAQ